MCSSDLGMRAMKREPLSDEEIVKVWNSFERDDSNLPFVNFARAIEERHGIK